ncbi:MAG: translation initiation factor IF-2 subunit gamma [Candidatus Nanohaloarchaeota archaeon QJJ-7]|nr:translation initiation factor IF-2 subunit gamma [Candidatus Nanohaloarchaeota archaeon QJJ-7]
MGETPVPEANIGLVGHVDHGKTTLTNALSGEWTDTHSEELRRGITIRLGYADITVRQCQDCGSYTVEDTCEECGEETEIARSVSLVDAPGHETLMANVLSGAAIMDGALLLVAADEEVPQPQTREHLAALERVGIENIVVVQNKIDLVSEEEAEENYRQLEQFLEGTVAEDSPVIPVSAQHGANIDVLIEAIEEEIPTPERDSEADPKMLVARSFDINKPGASPEKLSGGVVGGSLQRGEIEEGDDIALKPGYEREGSWETVETEARSIIHGDKTVEKGRPGGLLGVETGLDPSLAKSDSLAGNVLGLKGELPPVRESLQIEVDLMGHVVGSEEKKEVEPVKENEPLLLNVGTGKSSGVVTTAGKTIEVDLKRPVCAEEGDTVAVSRRMGSRWRLIGTGTIN